MKKMVRSLTALLCTLAILLTVALPAAAAEGNEDDLYQPNPEFIGTYLGKDSSGVHQFEATIPADYRSQPTPLTPGPYYGHEESSDTRVVDFLAQYMYGVNPGQATVYYYTSFHENDTPQLRAKVEVTVVAAEDYQKGQPIGEIGHIHTWSHPQFTPATCKEEGRLWVACEECGIEITTETYDKSEEHTYRDSVTRQPTEELEGERTYTCEICGDSYTERIPKLTGTTGSGTGTTGSGTGTAGSGTGTTGSGSGTTGGGTGTTGGGTGTTGSGTTGSGHIHSWYYDREYPTCSREGRRYRTCKTCGEEETLSTEPKSAHTYRSAITRQPTQELEGERIYTCTECGSSYTERIPKLAGTTGITGGGTETTGGGTGTTGGGTETTGGGTGIIGGDAGIIGGGTGITGGTTEPLPGASGMAASDRGNPLHLRDDGNYELFWVDGLLIIDGSTGEPKEDHRKLKITTYSPEFKELSVKELPIELPQIGGVHFGEDYNFIVFGQNNFEESRTKEVLRVVKYSKDWVRQGAASLSDANTIGVIEQHGNLSFAEGGGMLYIHCGHAMFASPEDGLNHQANMTFSTRVSDMTITDKRCIVDNNSSGYVSHSLANDIIVDRDGKIVTLDTGDGYPNGTLLYRYAARAGEEKFTTGAGEQNRFVTWPGPRQDIRTGGMTCALAETSRGYLSAYLDTGKGAAYDYANDPWSLYLAFTPKDSFSAEATQIRPVVQLPAGAQELVAHAWLIPTSPEGGYLMWYTAAKTDKGFFGDHTLYYTTYSADGTTGTVRKLSGVPMPYNGPTLNGDKLVWTGSTEDMMGLQFCTLDPADGKTECVYATGELEKIKQFSDVREGDWFKPYVDKVSAAGLMSGISEDQFGPRGNLTVAQALVLAYSTCHFYWDEDGETLPDVGGGWYMPYYQWCVDKRIINPGRFPAAGLNRLCTRYEMLEILDKAYGEPSFQQVKTVDSIPDVPAGGARGDMVYRWYRGGIVSGSSDGLFHGDSNITRAEVSVILCQLERL